MIRRMVFMLVLSAAVVTQGSAMTAAGPCLDAGCLPYGNCTLHGCECDSEQCICYMTCYWNGRVGECHELTSGGRGCTWYGDPRAST